MLRTNTSLWRIAFLSGFGVLPSACGGHTADMVAPGDGDAPRGTTTPGGTDTSTAAVPTSTPTPPTGTPCIDSAPFTIYAGVATGLERCQDHRVHRPAPVQCASKLPRSSAADAPAPAPWISDAGADGLAADGGTAPDRPAPSGGTASNSCSSDSDCTAKPLGHCEVPNSYGGLVSGMTCEYGCREDADCGRGFLCQCGDPVGACVPANCHTDSDCGADLLCAQGTGARASGCGSVYEFSCERPHDVCRLDSDCPPTTFGSYCALTNEVRVCKALDGSICGRPFLVEGRARLAEIERSSEWHVAGEAGPDCSRISAAERAELARAWSQLGLMEHASVAAFARFTLQLLSLGAPIALLEQSQQALSDELLHARLCFGLASAYAGEPIGPGPLPIEHALDLHSLEDIAALTLHEGCVGETIAAIEASEALALAVDPAVRATLTRIQDDERRHAELGWRFVTWAIQTGGASVQRRIQRELAELVVHAPEAWRVEETSSFDTAPQGILSARQRAELRAAALRDVVLPCAQVLLPAAKVSVCRDDCAA